MADRRLIIHLGVQKTASTSLQGLLTLNDAALKPRLAAFTPVPYTPVPKMALTGLEFSLDPSPWRKELFGKMIARVRDDIAPWEQTCLISHENLPGAVLGNGPTRTLYPQIGQILEMLDQGFAPLVPEYVIYTREMADWKPSVHAQVVISDRYVGTLAEFRAEMADCGTWAELEARVKAQVGVERLRVFRMEDEPDADRPGQQLLRYAGVTQTEIDALRPVARLNTRVSQAGVEFARQLNLSALERPALKLAINTLLANQTLFSSDWGETEGASAHD
jgi:hypothetical protein